jgi:hypothetical protein
MSIHLSAIIETVSTSLMTKEHNGASIIKHVKIMSPIDIYSKDNSIKLIQIMLIFKMHSLY